MKVELLSHTTNPDQLCGAIARTCYSTDDAGKLIAKGKDYTQTLKRVVESGHHSVIEHAVFTFNISGISRVASHQLVRHRIASITQTSQRYTTSDTLDTTYPDIIYDNEEVRNMIFTLEDIISDIAEELRENGIKEEDIRYIYPNSMKTNIVLTMNARSLLNFFSLRCCNRAQTEIRELAEKMLSLCKKVAPVIFEDAGKPCIRGECPEGTLSCEERE